MEPDRYLIVLPTYNERGNLPRMVEAIGAVRDRLPMQGDVLVVDDSSPDGTGDLADELATRHSWLSVLHRAEKQGLGRAYLAGFKWALERPYTHILEAVRQVPQLRLRALRGGLVEGEEPCPAPLADTLSGSDI